MGHSISPNSVRKLLVEIGFSRQVNRKADEGSSHPDRNAQFEYINAEVLAAHAAGRSRRFRGLNSARAERCRDANPQLAISTTADGRKRRR
jgi:Rhodopirellula transposase DDE domain